MSKSDGTLAEGPYTYDPYGNCVGGGSSCGTGDPYRFPGQRLDPETGLYYYRARYYSPALGRFLQTDPIGYKDDIDWYTYVGNDPTDLTDPSGNGAVGEVVGGFIAPLMTGFIPDLDGDYTNQITGNSVPHEQGMATMAVLMAPIGGAAAEGAEARAMSAEMRAIAAEERVAARIEISRSEHADAADHIERAQAAGHPSNHTIDRPGRSQRRKESLKGIAPKAGRHRDEYPPAMFKEGGKGSSVEYINPSDNTGSGAKIGYRCRSMKNGQKVIIVVCD